MLKINLLEFADFRSLKLIEVSTHSCVQDAHLLCSGHRDELILLEELGKLLTTVELLLGGNIEIGSELCEGGDFTILGQLELERTGDLLHGLDLGGRTDTRHGQTHIDSGANTLEEELSLEENLTVSDGDHIRGNVSRHITGLGLNNGQCGQRAATVVRVHLGSTLKETRVKIEDITGVGLTTGWATQQKRHLTVSNGLLGQIVIDDKSVHAIITEVLANSATRVG